MTNLTNKILLSLVLAASATGCSSTDVDGQVQRSNQNSLISEFYASVQSVKPVTLSSNVNEGMVGGAAVGLIENADGNSEDMVAGTIAGALVGGLFTAIFEGSNDAFEYQINSHSHGQFTVVQKEQLPESATCLKVRSGNEVKMTPVDEQFCQAPHNDNLAQVSD